MSADTNLPAIIDTHAHYNLSPLLEDWKKHLADAQNAGVSTSIVVGTTLETSQIAVDLATQSGGKLHPSVGIHPTHVSELTPQDQTPEQVSQQVVSTFFCTNSSSGAAKIVAIGEIGLDYFRLKRDSVTFESEISVQRQFFISQLQIAQTFQLPVILHVRDSSIPETPTPNNAYWDALTILQEHKPKAGFVLHCASGPLSYIQNALDLGGYIGIDGNSTYTNAHHIRTLISASPADKILLETDAPYLPPVPYRGQTCLPSMIRQTAEYAQVHLDCDLNQIYENSLALFPLLKV